MSWGWRKILQLRPIIRHHIWTSIGNGESTSLWFDKWCTRGPLSDDISSRDMNKEGLTQKSLVKEVVQYDSWIWPEYLKIKYPFIIDLQVPVLKLEVADKLFWHGEDGDLMPFTVQNVWSTIRCRNPKVAWYPLVWFTHCIPRHAFHLWLVVLEKLKTQDQVSSWEVLTNLPSVCPLCELEPDSHTHLFFECFFATKVWELVRNHAGFPRMKPIFQEILKVIIPIAKRRTSRSIIAKLVIAASTYYIWRERNNRLFRNERCSAVTVSEIILRTVRLKLLSCRFRKTAGGVQSAQLWNLPNSCLIDDRVI